MFATFVASLPYFSVINVYFVKIYFKKAFNRVWHEGLWQITNNFNIDTHVIDLIEELHKNTHIAVLMNNKIGDFFRTAAGVRQGCLLSPTLFNVFLEHIMIVAFDGFQPSIAIHGRPICNLRFADDIDLIACSANDLEDLTS